MNAHFELVLTDADQPWHVRFDGGNGEPVLMGENLLHEQDARRVVLLVAETFGWADPLFQPEASGEWSVVAAGKFTGARVRFVDERVEVLEPPT